MSIRKIIDWAIQDQKTEMQGKIVGPPKKIYDNAGNWVWGSDVELGNGETNSTLYSVPIASNNLDIIYSEQGKGVSLSQMGNAKWSISGLSKVVNNTVRTTCVTFVDDVFTIGTIVTVGDIIRPITYGELGTLVSPYGYGVLPYGMQAKFDYDGNFIEMMEY